MPHDIVQPETDKDSTSLYEGDVNPNAGTSHLSQGPNTDEAPLLNGVPVTDESTEG